MPGEDGRGGRRRVQVAVVGPAEADPELCRVAHRVGGSLARAGAVVVCGGLGGVMAAVCEGAAEAGGVTLGLLPGADPGAANPHVQVVVPTGIGQARNALVVAAADAVISVGASWGTLSEVALACRAGVPVVAIQGWQVTGDDGRAVPHGPAVASDADEAVRMALSAALR